MPSYLYLSNIPLSLVKSTLSLSFYHLVTNRHTHSLSLFISLTLYMTHCLSLTQCDQMARLFFIIWLLTAAQICQKFMKISKVGLTFCQTQNKPSKVCLRFLKVCPRAKISPNLVTLHSLAHSLSLSLSLFLILNFSCTSLSVPACDIGGGEFSCSLL